MSVPFNLDLKEAALHQSVPFSMDLREAALHQFCSFQLDSEEAALHHVCSFQLGEGCTPSFCSFHMDLRRLHSINLFLSVWT